MKNILYINACIRECSRTNELTQCLISNLDGHIQTVDLSEINIKPLNSALLEKRDKLLKNGETDNAFFSLAKQFASADIIVIAAPYWDLMFPSILKVYLENITVCGVTFRYSEKGDVQSLCKAKKLYYVTTSGGFIGENNFGYDYIKKVAAGFFGINDISFFSAEGLDIEGADIAQILQKAKESILCNSENI